MFELMDAYSQSAVIKVLGVGGGGGNAVSHMVASGIEGVEFICINTDSQALKASKVKTALQRDYPGISFTRVDTVSGKVSGELFKTGMQAFVKGDAKSAVTSFRKATAANPSYGAAWRALGLAHEKLGEWGPAKTAFQKYLSVSPNAADAAQIRERIKNL